MNEKEYIPTHLNKRGRRFITAVGGILLTASSLTACSQNSVQECGQTVKLDLESGPSAFLSIENEEYALFVKDKHNIRRIELSKGKTIEEQFSNELHEVDLEGNGKTLSGSLEIDGVQVSFTSALGSNNVKTGCHKLD